MGDNITASTMAEKCKKYDPTDPANTQSQLYVQLVLSLALGLSAFLGFCFLRPRWKGLYAARKKRLDNDVALPDLPDTFFGWIPVLYRVTEEQVLASAGLDAHVFLAFFKMSMKLFGTMFLLTAAILAPINNHFLDLPDLGWNSTASILSGTDETTNLGWGGPMLVMEDKPKGPKVQLLDTSYLWAYCFFTYVFSGIAFYFMTLETRRIIQIRQDYLGSQSTTTDRTLRLSGIPQELRSEEKIKGFIEKLEIGKVESVTICRNWSKLDELMEKRSSTLRRLEEAWTIYQGQEKSAKQPEADSTNATEEGADDEGGEEEDTLLGRRNKSPGNPRPTTRLWYGFLNLQYKNVDAINYYEERLRKLDDQVKEARKKEYKATPSAFVTMDSIPACQMAVQALLDPHPLQLIAKLAPAPSDIVWPNTYLSRTSRMLRSWTITLLVVFLTIIWLIPVVALAGLIDLCSIRQVFPQLASFLEDHTILKALVQTGLPTLVVSLLNVAVPFLYDWLSNMQGIISQGDVELSLISKNFFFTFFNVFVVFTVFGTASTFWPVLQDSLKDTTWLAYQIARSVRGLSQFYTNFILLQGVGLLPFRLLEFGSVLLYPILRFLAKTPRDNAELVMPPVFKYGFYLPSAILVWILCMVYSILPAGYLALFFGLIYFVFGYYTYKYQVLYAMDHPQHATGGAWPMICNRLLLGLGVFQLTMAGLIALSNSFTPALLTVPLIPFTMWYSYYYSRKFKPLTRFIALRSIRRESNPDINIADRDVGLSRPPGRIRRGSKTDESREKGLTYVNPSLVVPLDKLWVNSVSESNGDHTDLPVALHDREESAASSVSLGDTHIWRDNGDANV